MYIKQSYSAKYNRSGAGAATFITNVSLDGYEPQIVALTSASLRSDGPRPDSLSIWLDKDGRNDIVKGTVYYVYGEDGAYGDVYFDVYYTVK